MVIVRNKNWPVFCFMPIMQLTDDFLTGDDPMREQPAQLGSQGGVTQPALAAMATTLMDSLSIGVLLVNPERVLTFINGKAEELLQIGRDQVLGKRVDMLPLRS